MATTPTLPPDMVRKFTADEMRKFFIGVLRRPGSRPNWPGIDDQPFIEALADAVFDAGEASGRGIGFLQLLAIELQERVNTKMNSKG